MELVTKKDLIPNFENVNGAQGMLQVAVEVNPTNGVFKFVRSNTNMR